MFGSFSRIPEHPEAFDRVKEWTRERFELPGDAAIFVSEITCSSPGCPPLETVVAFWPDEERRQFKLFKPVAEVIVDDLPPSWMKNALLPVEALGGGCC